VRFLKSTALNRQLSPPPGSTEAVGSRPRTGEAIGTRARGPFAAVQKQASAALRATTAEKQVRRAEREVELAGKILALPDLKADVIYADPPWRFEVYSRDTGLDRDASNRYPTMSLEKISRQAYLLHLKSPTH
jgi:hypothetical protein